MGAAEKLDADLMTVDQLAARLGINRKTAYDKVKTGEIPGVKRLGRIFRVHRPTIEQWLASDLEKR